MAYDWLRTLALADLPHHRDQVRPEFWRAVKRAESSMKPTQRKVYDLYRCGMTAQGIAALLGWKESSVRARLVEIAAIVGAEIDSKRERVKIG
jgi:DNA-directed RNA polymerase specialized sigma24 family protein